MPNLDYACNFLYASDATNEPVLPVHFLLPSGCHLAHSMGLGKTMEVVILLAALAEAAGSDDEALMSLLPKHSRSMNV